jgi:hypothetical protein
MVAASVQSGGSGGNSGTGGALITLEQQLAKIDKIASECNLTKAPKSFGTSIMVARAMQELRDILQGEILSSLMQLQGTELGFVTDRDKRPKDAPADWKPGYPEHVVRDVAIAAILRGFQMVNNEVNIIAGKFYGAKNGFIRLVRELPGLAELKIKEGRVVKSSDVVALVPMSVTWKLRGVADSIECDVPVKIDQYSTIDQILGKATRKILARVYARVTGSKALLDEIDTDDAVVGDVVNADEPATVTQIADNQQSQAAQQALETLDDKVAAWTAYCKAMAVAGSLGECDLLYDTAFGPDRIVSWEPEDDQRAARLRDGRKTVIAAEKGGMR